MVLCNAITGNFFEVYIQICFRFTACNLISDVLGITDEPNLMNNEFSFNGKNLMSLCERACFYSCFVNCAYMHLDISVVVLNEKKRNFVGTFVQTYLPINRS